LYSRIKWVLKKNKKKKRRGGEDGDKDAVYELDNDGEGDEDKEASINFKRDGVVLRCTVQKDCSATGDGEDGVGLLNEGEEFFLFF
jgi:hypothetical protein